MANSKQKIWSHTIRHPHTHTHVRTHTYALAHTHTEWNTKPFWHVLFYFLNTSLSSALHVSIKVFVCECVWEWETKSKRERERERERKGENVRLWKTENFFRIINIWGQFHHRHFTTSVCDSWFTPIFLLNNLDNRV